jgi:Family of unknown function (DUF6356)
MQHLFKDHPASVGEGYFQHMGVAFRFAGRLLAAAFACFVHGLLPFLFTKTGSSAVKRLHEEFILGRSRRRQAHVPADEVSLAP